MTSAQRTGEGRTALRVACNPEISGGSFLMQTEEADRDRLLEITRDHVREKHGKDYTLDEIAERHVTEVEV